MSEMLFYERVVALNDQAHAALRVKPVTRFAYAQKSNSVPILAAEFADCAREYPIVFARGDQGTVPAVLLGLREQENLFVNADGEWDARYVPAFVRRYPFVPGKDGQGQLVVCIDEAAPCFDQQEGEPLFAEGKPTKQLEHAMNFLRDFQQGAEMTEALGARLDALGLLRDADSVAQLKDGSQFRLSGLRVVDEAKLRALDQATVMELFSNGTLGLIYAHILSLGNLGRLVDMMAKVGAGGTVATKH
jgi:hypothetical protein